MPSNYQTHAYLRMSRTDYDKTIDDVILYFGLLWNFYRVDKKRFFSIILSERPSSTNSIKLNYVKEYTGYPIRKEMTQALMLVMKCPNP